MEKNRKQQMRRSLLLNDLKYNLPGLLVVAGYILVFQLFLHTICPMQLIFGLPCPGCGLTRAATLLITGHFAQSFQMHPFLIAWILMAADWGLSRYVFMRKAKELPVLLGLVLIGMVVLYLYRMRVYYPHTQPMNPLMKGMVPTLIDMVRG